MKKPAEIAETVLQGHCIREGWARSREQIIPLMTEAIELDRAQHAHQPRRPERKEA